MWRQSPVAFAPLVYFWPALREGRALSPDDGVIFNIPLRVAAANLIRSGQLPLWNPYMFCGLPLHGAAQAGLLFPLNWFYVVSSPRIATNLMMLSTYMVAAVGAYLYSRRARGGHRRRHRDQSDLAMVRLHGRTDRPYKHCAHGRGVAMVAVGHRWLSGHRRTQARNSVCRPGPANFCRTSTDIRLFVLLVSAYALVMSRPLPEARKRLAQLQYFIVAGLALAAVQILPTFELLRNSLRAEATYEFFSSFSMPPRFV